MKSGDSGRHFDLDRGSLPRGLALEFEDEGGKVEDEDLRCLADLLLLTLADNTGEVTEVGGAEEGEAEE